MTSTVPEEHKRRERNHKTEGAAGLIIPSPVHLDRFEQWNSPPCGGRKELNFSRLYPETANIVRGYISH